jgi:hypothetical protein
MDLASLRGVALHHSRFGSVWRAKFLRRGRIGATVGWPAGSRPGVAGQTFRIGRDDVRTNGRLHRHRLGAGPCQIRADIGQLKITLQDRCNVRIVFDHYDGSTTLHDGDRATPGEWTPD